MTIGDRIKIRRKEIGLGQKELAEIVGESKQTIYKYENNKVTNIPIEKIQLIAKALNISPSALLGYETEKPADLEIDGLEAELIKLLSDLSPDEMSKVDAFVQGLLANRAEPSFPDK